MTISASEDLELDPLTASAVEEYFREQESGSPVMVAELVKAFPGSEQVILGLSEGDKWLSGITASFRETSLSGHADDFDLHPPTPQGYELYEQIGEGGMGVVFRARQVKLDRIVAIKFLRAGVLANKMEQERFRREAKTLATIDHPNIIHVYDYGRIDSYDYCVTEFVAGGSLKTRMERRPWPESKATQLLETLARAVAAVHAKGIIHRDLKPGNVFLTPEGIPKVGDFGLARSASVPSMTGSGAIVGTPSYMAPEQIDGPETGITADVYALGIILYELLTGQVPFPGTTPQQTFDMIRTTAPKRPSGLNAALVAICMKCLEKNPGDRYASANELADALSAIIPSLDPIVQSDNTPSILGKSRIISEHLFSRTAISLSKPRRRLLIAAGFAAIVAMMLGVVIIIIIIEGKDVGRDKKNNEIPIPKHKEPDNKIPGQKSKDSSLPSTPKVDGNPVREMSRVRITTQTGGYDKHTDGRLVHTIQKGSTGLVVKIVEDRNYGLVRLDNPVGEEVWVDLDWVVPE
jgi:serine/threonine protein kinase